jgi:UDP-glucose 4-epimerase
MHVLNAVGEEQLHKLVLLSTTLVYGALPSNPNFLTEQHEAHGHPRSRFVNDKLEAERQARRFAHENPGTVVTVMRAGATLGPTIDNFATRFFSRPVCPVLMGFDPLMQFVDEDDLADALELAVSGDHPGTFNVVGDGVLPYTTVLAMMGRLPLPLPHFLAYPLSRALWMTQVFDSPPNFLDFVRYLCVADGTQAKRELGFRPRYDMKAIIARFLGGTMAGAERAGGPGAVAGQGA